MWEVVRPKRRKLTRFLMVKLSVVLLFLFLIDGKICQMMGNAEFRYGLGLSALSFSLELGVSTDAEGRCRGDR